MKGKKAFQNMWVLAAAMIFLFSAIPLHAEPITADLQLGLPQKTIANTASLLTKNFQFKKIAPDKSFTGTVWENAKHYLFISKDNTVAAVFDSGKPDAAIPGMVKINFAGKQNFDSPDSITVLLEFKTYGDNYYGSLQNAEMELPINGQNCKAFFSAHASFRPKGKNSYISVSICQAAWADVMIAGENRTISIGPESPYPDFPIPNDKTKYVAVIMPKMFAGGIPVVSRVTLGQPTNIKDKWFILSLSENGKKLILNDYTGPLGKLEWPASLKTVMMMTGRFDVKAPEKMPSSLISFSPDNVKDNVAELPVGEYTVIAFVLAFPSQKTGKNTQVTVMSDIPKNVKVISVTADKPVSLCDENQKITISPDLDVNGRSVMLKGIIASGFDGMRVDVSAMAEKIAFYSAVLQLVHEGKLEYG